jgi:hypothetical protein
VSSEKMDTAPRPLTTHSPTMPPMATSLLPSVVCTGARRTPIIISGERTSSPLEPWSRLPRDARTSLGSPRNGTFATALPILRVTLGLDEPAAATDDELPVNDSQLRRPCDELREVQMPIAAAIHSVTP